MPGIKCKECGKECRSRAILINHLRTHTGEKPFRCNVCEKRFAEQSGLTRHMRTHTTGEKPFRCDVCEKGFAEQSGLTRHMRTHTGEKPYSCDVCEKGFAEQSGLTRHMRTHTGEKPYSCDVCKKAFNHRGNLSRHTLTHTGQEFRCPDCGAVYTQQYRLKQHMEQRHSAPNTPDITVSTHASAGVITTTHSFNSGPDSSTITSVSYIGPLLDEERPPVQVVTSLTRSTETIMVKQLDGKVIVTTEPRAETDPRNSSSQ
ncbi:C2H2-type zinc finger protein [Endozoicomonas euniceicola]|uniref:C2H2-type zinc finger protein n=1 Tax=Endozoicomonas euniceicola TaxID=1234143 RepID=UPI00384F3EA3